MGSPQKVFPGDRFGALEVKSRDGKYALCRCDCGTRTRIQSGVLQAGKKTHCGCQKKSKAVAS